MRFWAEDLLHFWFHELNEAQRFARDDAVDAELRRRFAGTLAAMGKRPAREFLCHLPTARAAILLFDQVPRNLFRNDPRAFAYDPLARAITWGIMRGGGDHGLSKPARHFVYMPLMHSEHIADQRESLRRFAAMGDSSHFAFARAHYRMIARFGRFTHRNAVLGRKSSTAERRAIAAGNSW
jgi:uncharacterized protein (DUF924 family)